MRYQAIIIKQAEVSRRFILVTMKLDKVLKYGTYGADYCHLENFKICLSCK